LPAFVFHSQLSYVYTLGFAKVSAHQRIWDFELILKPMFLGGVMAATGNQVNFVIGYD